MKYKINNLMIDAKSPVEATKIAKLFSKCKDSVKDSKNYKIYQQTPFGTFFITTWEHNSPEEAVKEFLEYNPKYKSRGTIVAKDSVKDDDLTYLTAEEEKAIDDYKKAISNTSDPKMLRIFSHILKEETDHLEELQNENVEDSCKTEDDITSDILNMLNMAKDYASNSDWQRVANLCWSIADKLKKAHLAQ